MHSAKRPEDFQHSPPGPDDPGPTSSRPRHEAVRRYPALYHFALAERAVAEGRASWVPMSGEGGAR
jgi:hypothetical protein